MGGISGSSSMPGHSQDMNDIDLVDNFLTCSNTFFFFFWQRCVAVNPPKKMWVLYLSFCIALTWLGSVGW